MELHFVYVLWPGVGTVVAVDEELTDKQKGDLAVAFLMEIAGAQAPVCCALWVSGEAEERQKRNRV